MTEAQYREIWRKTNGHCHFCGDPISLHKRGYRRQRADGCWEVDHVIQRDKAGQSSIENYLPACTSCNRLRWHRKGPQLRELLILGIIAKREMERFSETGKKLIELRHQQLKTNQRRRSGESPIKKSLIDPVLKAQIRQEERDLLVGFLKKHRKRSFTAGELKRSTGVPKSRVRRLLETSEKISVTGHGDRYLFKAVIRSARGWFKVPKRPFKLSIRIPPYEYPRNAWRKKLHRLVRARQRRSTVRYLESDKLELSFGFIYRVPRLRYTMSITDSYAAARVHCLRQVQV